MRDVKTFCDICEENCGTQMSALAGSLIKMNDKAEMGRVQFEGHYCSECTQKILDYVNKLRNERTINNKNKLNNKGNTGKK